MSICAYNVIAGVCVKLLKRPLITVETRLTNTKLNEKDPKIIILIIKIPIQTIHLYLVVFPGFHCIVVAVYVCLNFRIGSRSAAMKQGICYIQMKEKCYTE